MSVQFEPYPSFGCFSWEKQVGNEKSDNLFRREGSKDVYGTISKASTGELRAIFTTLFFLQGPCLVSKVFARVIGLLWGDFIRVGYANGQAEWRDNLIRTYDYERIPFCGGRFACVTKHILRELTKDIIQIATLPLASVALFFICLYGVVISPLDARCFYAAIENAWMPSELFFLPHSFCENMPALRLILNQLWDQSYICTAPCMQTNVFIKEERNGIKIFFPTLHHPHTMRSLCWSIQNIFRRNRLLFDKFLTKKHCLFLENIETFKVRFKKFSSADMSEIVDQGKLASVTPEDIVEKIQEAASALEVLAKDDSNILVYKDTLERENQNWKRLVECEDEQFKSLFTENVDRFYGISKDLEVDLQERLQLLEKLEQNPKEGRESPEEASKINKKRLLKAIEAVSNAKLSVFLLQTSVITECLSIILKNLEKFEAESINWLNRDLLKPPPIIVRYEDPMVNEAIGYLQERFGEVDEKEAFEVSSEESDEESSRSSSERSGSEVEGPIEASEDGAENQERVAEEEEE